MVLPREVPAGSFLVVGGVPGRERICVVGRGDIELVFLVLILDLGPLDTVLLDLDLIGLASEVVNPAGEDPGIVARVFPVWKKPEISPWAIEVAQSKVQVDLSDQFVQVVNPVRQI